MPKKVTTLAVISTGGKQYLVHEGQKMKVEKLPSPVGESIAFKQVLLTVKGKKTVVGTPHVKQAKVEAKVLSHARHPKIFGAKMKAKKRYRRILGHKQAYTEIEISEILL